eukprot:TRINITY_DN61673_c0_g1_i1.p1 TRINITY_DN61673_c0_g1~~TRINITY_DN61673_c0_g1_i1.p1  ORF type:complete len:679 (+),score=431.56 TRINITY_DN61673_c0_g1_i1:212-2248(+)
MLPLLYPLASWSFEAQPAPLVEPTEEEDMKRAADKCTLEPLVEREVSVVKGFSWFVSTLPLTFRVFYSPSIFRDSRKVNAARISVGITVVALALLVPAAVNVVGLAGVLRFWVGPLALFHVVLSVFFALRTTVPESTALANLPQSADRVVNTVCARLPAALRPVEFLFNGLNYYIPHADVAARLPSYNVRKAYRAVAAKWAKYMPEIALTPRTFTELHRECGRIQETRFYPTQAALYQKQQAELKRAMKDKEIEEIDADLAEFRANLYDKWYQRIYWLHVIILFGTPALGIYGYMTTPCETKTLVWSVLYYYLTGIGITGGYHRLWSHRAYRASAPLEVVLALLSAGSVQGSAIWWSKKHRIHHRYTDTAFDPYSAKGGFLWAHFGWMMVHPKKDPSGAKPHADIKDLQENWVLRWQHRFYLPMLLIMGYILPTVVAGLGWGDWRGGYFYAGVLRLCFVHHSTFCVNSVAHFFGEHTYDDERTPKDSLFTAFLTLGEGYHNFHHEFPFDYRNGIRWYDYDPTKWTIALLSSLGLAYDLRRFPSNEIQKGKLKMKQKKLNKAKDELTWPRALDELPVMTPEQVKDQVKNHGAKLVIIDGLVHDVSVLIGQHPGGEAILRLRLGTDATRAFYGEVYRHSNAARNLLANLRVARLPSKNTNEDTTQLIPDNEALKFKPKLL